jgi:hypothetical protein
MTDHEVPSTVRKHFIEEPYFRRDAGAAAATSISAFHPCWDIFAVKHDRDTSWFE